MMFQPRENICEKIYDGNPGKATVELSKKIGSFDFLYIIFKDNGGIYQEFIPVKVFKEQGECRLYSSNVGMSISYVNNNSIKFNYNSTLVNWVIYGIR